MSYAVTVEHLWKKFTLKKDRSDSIGQLFFRMIPKLGSSHGPSRQDFWALKDITFAVPKGQSLGIVGDNGSGKSTLLKILTKTMLPTSGALSVEGSVSALIELGAGFHPDFTGRENIYVSGSILGLSTRETRQLVPSIIDFSELGGFIDTPVKYFSSGMSARLGFAVATAVNPDILIVDEVLAVGDESFQRKCLQKIRDLRQRGTTILIVSHSLDMMTEVTDTIAWIQHGELKGIGLPGDILEMYRTYTANGELRK